MTGWMDESSLCVAVVTWLTYKSSSLRSPPLPTQRSTPARQVRESLLEEEFRNEQQRWTEFLTPTSHQCQISAQTLLGISVCRTSDSAIVQASGSSAGGHPSPVFRSIISRTSWRGGNHSRAVALMPVTLNGFRGHCAEPASSGKVNALHPACKHIAARSTNLFFFWSHVVSIYSTGQSVPSWWLCCYLKRKTYGETGNAT